MALGTVIRSFAAPGGSCIGLCWDGRTIWLSDNGASLIYQVNPVTGTVIRSFAAPGFEEGLAWDGQALWFVDAGNLLIHQIDPVTGTVIRNFAAPSNAPIGAAWDGRALWHSDFNTDLIYQIDPTTGTVIRSFAAPDDTVRGLAWDGHHLWCSGDSNNRIYELDPISGTVIRSFASPGTSPAGLAWDGRTLWHVDYQTDLVYQISVSGRGTTYYVDATGGNDANDGFSPRQAWQTIGQVNGSTFLPDDRILFKCGETWTGTALVVPSSGVSGRRITFGAYDSGARPIIDGGDAVNCIEVNAKSYIIIDGIEVTQGFSFGIYVYDGSGYVDVLNCTASDCGLDNIIFIDQVHHCTCIGCTSYDVYERVAGPVSCIEIADEAHDIVVRDCECYGAAGTQGQGITIHSHAATEFPYNLDISDCNFHDNGAYGIHLAQDNAAPSPPANVQINIVDCTCTDNGAGRGEIYTVATGDPWPIGIVFDGCTAISTHNSFALYAGGDNVTYRRCLFHGVWKNDILGDGNIFENCTFYRVASLCLDVEATVDGLTMRNCIIESEGNVPITCDAGCVNIDIDYCLYWSAANPNTNNVMFWQGIGYNWANWLINSGQDANSPTPADPLFVDAANDDFHLQATSPARGVGTDLGYGTDLGAYQYGS